jgi:hypothetical protein
VELKRFDVPSRATIWCVDDAWFNITGPRDNPYSLHERLEDCWEDLRTLDDLIGALEKPDAEMSQNPTLTYLYELAKICKQEEFSIRLCSFEEFPKHFPYLNARWNACLIDVMYEEKNDNYYGIDMIRDCLNGRRPLCDIFFVTSHSGIVHERLTQMSRDALWWPLRTIPVVEKPTSVGPGATELLKSELTTFSRYFASGLEYGQLRELLLALLESNGHPYESSELSSLPESFPLLTEFKQNFDENLDSLKALCYRSKNEHREWRARYSIKTSVLAALLHELGVELRVENLSSVKLPFGPGIIFIIYLVAFLRAAQVGSILLSRRLNSGPVAYELRVELRDPLAFRARFFGGGRGDATEKLRDLLRCRGDLLIDKFAVSKNPDLVNWHDPYRYSEVLGRWVREIVAEVEFSDRSLILWWSVNEEPEALE